MLCVMRANQYPSGQSQALALPAFAMVRTFFFFLHNALAAGATLVKCNAKGCVISSSHQQQVVSH